MVLHGKKPCSKKLAPYIDRIDRSRCHGAVKVATPQQAVTITSFTVNAPKAYLIPLYDLHVGSPWFREDVFLGYREWILAQQHAYVVAGGDFHENMVADNRASNVFEQTMSPYEQLDKTTELLLPLRNRILAGCTGNHDRRHVQRTSLDLMSLLWDRLQLPRNTFGAMAVYLRMVVGTACYDLYMVHGWGGARNAGGQVNKLEELSKVIDADVFLAGHEHTLTHSRINHRIVDHEGNAQSKRKLFIGCGGFKDYDPFLVNIGRRPPDVGAPRIRFDGERKDIHVSF